MLVVSSHHLTIHAFLIICSIAKTNNHFHIILRKVFYSKKIFFNVMFLFTVPECTGYSRGVVL